MPAWNFSEYERPTLPPFLKVTHSANQSPSTEYYAHPPLTFPNPLQPILPQWNNFLASEATPPPDMHMRQPLYGGPYGRLGLTKDPEIVATKLLLAELPPTVSLEARSVFLTTLLRKFSPSSLFATNLLPSLYDHNRDRHLAQDIYGGNGLYAAVEEWMTLAKGQLPEVPQKIKVPWLTMHIRHTFLRNPQLLDDIDSVQTSIAMIRLFDTHYRHPAEDESAYIERMSGPYWQSHLELLRLNLLPGYQKVTRAL